MCTPPGLTRDMSSKQQEPLFLPNSPDTAFETAGPMHAADSGPLDHDEPFTVDCDMFELLDSVVDNSLPESSSIPHAGDSQVHERRSPTAQHKDEDTQVISTRQKQVHWQDDESDEDAFATALEELEAWVQSGAVEIIPDD